jgi:hypothetical protein
MEKDDEKWNSHKTDLADLKEENVSYKKLIDDLKVNDVANMTQYKKIGAEEII